MNHSKRQNYAPRSPRQLAKSTDRSNRYRSESPEIYTPSKDSTLTSKQATQGAFFNGMGTGFRYPSNQTQEGHKSGYHEAFLVTSGYNEMMKHRNSLTNKEHYIINAGDGARTDTARTILSAKEGRFAGHSGSNVKTTNQAEAHDLLREQVDRIAGDNNMTPNAVTYLAGATLLASMAPGKHARTVQNSALLKDDSAKDSWEKDRNEAKDRLDHLRTKLTPDEKLIANSHMRNYFKELGQDRQIEQGTEHSPRRKVSEGGFGEIQGGDYDDNVKARRPKIQFGVLTKDDPQRATLYMSQPFRANRQSAGGPIKSYKKTKTKFSPY